MSERRYVVELTKPVPASRLPSASQEIARRLGLDVSRVVTLLKDRVGPVSKPVLAAKADAIAAVFLEAGVDVAIYDAAAYQTDWGKPTQTGATVGASEGTPPAAEETAPTYGHVPPLPDLDRWEVDDPWGEPWREPGLAERPSEELDDVTEVPVPAADDEPPAVREEEPRAGDDLPRDDEDLPVAVRQTIEEWPLPPAEGEVRPRPGVWVPEGERRPLRPFLLVALGVAVVLFVLLQVMYASRGGSGGTYEDGLAAYRTGDFAAARATWERASAAGSPRADYMLGYLAQHGLGRPWSYREAAERYRSAADAGLPEAQLALGELYLEGLGVERDEAEGAAWVVRAADAGHAPALYRLGELRFHGVGVAQDFDAALEAFAAAADLGSGRAADFLGLAAHLRGGNLSGP